MSADEVKDYAQELAASAKREHDAPVVLPDLWSAYIWALRLLLSKLEVDFDINDFSDYALLGRAYSDGGLSYGDYEEAVWFLKLRNRAEHLAAHGVTLENCADLKAAIEAILKRLSPPRLPK